VARATAALLALALCADHARAADPPTKPNIVLILADDLGYECLGCNGGTSYATPHLDRLAAGGVRFEHCHVQPLCTPTRAQLLTGLYNVRNYTRFGRLEPDAVTFANLLKNSGYATGIAGKWQLAGDFDAPKRFGFDEYCLWQLTRRPPRYANPGLEVNGKEVNYANGEYGPDLMSDWALDFVARHKAHPFFLYYPMLHTHAPFQPTPDSPDWDPKARGEQVNANPKHFAGNVAYMDKLVGKLLAALAKHGLRDDTLVIFLGDNGTDKAVVSKLGGKSVRGGKGTTTTFGTHVPLVVSWPTGAAGGRVCRDLVDSTDVLPTLCAAAGAPLPADPTPDGRSFLPQVRGQKGTPREWTYCWYAPNLGPSEDVPTEFAATARYKLYRDGTLYDYAADPEEKKPLEGSGGAEAAAARKQLQGVLDRFKDARPAKLMPPRKEDPKDSLSGGLTLIMLWGGMGGAALGGLIVYLVSRTRRREQQAEGHNAP
jgi:arylsulfatase A